MNSVSVEGVIDVPGWVVDLESFRRWAHSEAFPQNGLIAYLDGNLWIEVSMEKVVHNKAKGKIGSVLEGLISLTQAGHFFVDGMRLTHPEAGLSTEPDGSYASQDTLQRQRLQIEDGPEGAELVGSPDMVLEVVSKSSVRKDTVLLPDLYWKAGVTEYWLVDPQGETPQFTLFKRGKTRFEAVKPRSGWLKSVVFGKSFRLTMTINGAGLPVFELEVK